MDAGELINYRIDFESAGATEDLIATSRPACAASAPTPTALPTARPGSTACADPDRTNNPPCTEMTVLDSPSLVGTVPPGQDGLRQLQPLR